MFDVLKRSKLRRLALCLEQGEYVEAFVYIITRMGIRLPAPKPRLRAMMGSTSRNPRARPRIIATVHSLALEGAPISLLEILTGLNRTSAYDVHLISPTHGALSASARAQGITIHTVASPQNDSAGERAYERGAAHFAQFLSSLEPDVLIANSMATFHAVDAAKALGIPTLWLIREGESPESFFALYPRAIQSRALACLAYPFKTLFVSQSAMDRWPRADVSRAFVRTVPDRETMQRLLASYTRDAARTALHLEHDQVMILMVGTLCFNKGHVDLLHAAQGIDVLPTRSRIIFVGSVVEPGGKAILRAISRLPPRLREFVEVHPATFDIGKYYAAADIYACCSRREGYPRTILEALAFGLPIVTTMVDGIPEALEDTATKSYTPGDVDALAACLKALAQSAESRSLMAQSSRRRWTQLLENDHMIESYVRHVDELLRDTTQHRGTRLSAATTLPTDLQS